MTSPTSPYGTLEAQRLGIEFHAFNEALGNEQAKVLIPPSVLNRIAQTLTLPQGAPSGSSITATLRYRVGKDVPNKTIKPNNVIDLNVDPNVPVDERAGLIGVELVESIANPPGNVLRAIGVVIESPPPAISGFTPASRATVIATSDTQPKEIISVTAPSASLRVGSTFRIVLRGSLTAAKSKLTFTPYIGDKPAAQSFVMDNTTGTTDLSGSFNSFYLEIDATVRTASTDKNTPGSYIVQGYGRIEFPAPKTYDQTAEDLKTVKTVVAIAGVDTAAVDTSAGAAVVKVEATWAQSDVKNVLRVETATIEQIAYGVTP